MARGDYQEYLRSPEWQVLRRLAHERAGGRCQLCNARGQLDVHHRTYERLGHELLSDVIVLCRSCHDGHHVAAQLVQFPSTADARREHPVRRAPVARRRHAMPGGAERLEEFLAKTDMQRFFFWAGLRLRVERERRERGEAAA